LEEKGMRVKGKVTIITGGADGIGKETALLFGREGARLVIADYDSEKVAQIENLLKERGIESFFIKTDIRNSAEVQQMAELAIKRFGRIDILVNNAGAAGAVPVVELTEDNWDRIVDTNLKGVYLCCKYIIPKMIQGGGGVIVNMASVLAFIGRARASAYNAAKGGVVALTKNMALDYVANNIRINAVCTGFVDTDLVRRYVNASENPAKTYEELVQLHPMGRLAKPEEIAYSVLFLASDESSFITGSSLIIDGGYSAR
jgi:NAD(P)-dependent dehydrogenase (short-subunit alcohol dehydrogenase family)